VPPNNPCPPDRVKSTRSDLPAICAGREVSTHPGLIDPRSTERSGHRARRLPSDRVQHYPRYCRSIVSLFACQVSVNCQQAALGTLTIEG